MSEEPVRGKRKQRGATSNGREKLVQSARAVMRQKVPVRLYRKQIAEMAGVAPALVTYYFDDELSLVEAAARPIVEDYLFRLKIILKDIGPLRAQMTQLVLLLLEIGRNNGQLLDSYITYLKVHSLPNKTDLLTGSYVEIERFFTINHASGTLGAINPAMAASLLWGTCRTISQLPELDQILLQETDSRGQDIMHVQANLIVDFFLKALGPSGSA